MPYLIILSIVIIVGIGFNRAINYNEPNTGWSTAWEWEGGKTLERILISILILLIIAMLIILH